MFKSSFATTISISPSPSKSDAHIYDFYPDDGNSNPSIVLSDILGEVSGDVRVDNDGDLDIAVTNYYSSTVSVLRNNGDVTYAAKVDYGVGINPVDVSLGDIDNDGDLDIAVANYNSNTVAVLKNRNRSADIVLSSNSFFFGDVKVDSSKTLYLNNN